MEPSSTTEQPINRRFEKTRKAGRLVGRWITPWGMMQRIFITEFASMRLDDQSEIHNLQRAEQDNRILIIASALVALFSAIGLWWAINTTEASSGLTAMSLLAAAGILISLTKLGIGLHNRSYLKTYRAKHRPDAVDSSSSENDPEIDTADLDAALLVIMTFRNMYILITIFALGIFFYPSTFSRSLNLFNLYNDSTISGLVIFLTLLITAFLLLRAIIAHRDIQNFRALGARPRSHGYVTVNNAIYTIIQALIVMMLVAYIGDLVMDIISGLPIHYLWLSVIKICVFALMILFGAIGYKSAVNMAFMNTGSVPPNPLMILLFKPLYLPPPTSGQKTETLPPVKPIIALFLLLALLIAGNSNFGSLLLCVASLMPMALLLSIDQLHVEVKLYD